jgi:hypothetical protein
LEAKERGVITEEAFKAWAATARPSEILVHVECGLLGDGRTAIVESRTKEPIQYVTDAQTAKGLLRRWEASFDASAARNRGSR